MKFHAIILKQKKWRFIVKKLFIIVPCYNEEKVLPITAPLFLDKLNELIKKGLISDDSRVMFVNDGSTDLTWNIIKDLSIKDYHYIGISQSRNRGHQNAVLAGLMEAKDQCNITISIDCDGQDDINAIDEMIEKNNSGYEIVYGVRSNRDSDTFFKRFTAQSFYKLLNMMGVEVVYNHADYRLISSKVLEEFKNFHETNLYLRGMIPLVGFPSTSVYYSRHERIAGDSHYPLKKMLALAIDGITSLSIKPIRIITGTGVLFSVVGIICIILSFLKTFSNNNLFIYIAIMLFFTGIIMVSLGVVGEYVGKTYMETKNRPRYIISERTYIPKTKE